MHRSFKGPENQSVMGFYMNTQQQYGLLQFKDLRGSGLKWAGLSWKKMMKPVRIWQHLNEYLMRLFAYVARSLSVKFDQTTPTQS